MDEILQSGLEHPEVLLTNPFVQDDIKSQALKSKISDILILFLKARPNEGSKEILDPRILQGRLAGS